ncbi:ATP-binding cassette domain-containing protein [Klenkia terrae]
MSVPVMTVPGEAPPTTAAVRAVDLRKTYGKGETAVHALGGVDVGFERGRFTAIMGPSGSGKSTLMHCLAGLDTATAGQVWLGDTELTSLRDDQLTKLRRDRIGFVFQAFNLLPVLTAAENMTLPMQLAGRRPDRAWMDDVVARLGLRDRLGHRPTSCPAASSSGSPSPGPCSPPRRRLRRRADRQPGLPRRRRGAGPAALQRPGDRPDRRHGHPRPGRRRLRRPRRAAGRRAAGRRGPPPHRRRRHRRAPRAGWLTVNQVLLAQVRANAGRLIASMTAIVIAVAFVVATLVLNQTAKSTVLDSVGAQYAGTDLVLTSTDGESLADVVGPVSGVPGVRAVAPEWDTSVQAVLPDRAGARYVAVTALADDPLLRWQQLSAGAFPTGPGRSCSARPRGSRSATPSR